MTRQWTPEDVLHIARLFQPACVLTAAADWDVFSLLNEKSMTAEALAAKLNINLRATTVMLNALTAMELLNKDVNVYRVPDEIVELLTETSSNNILPMLRHTSNCLRRWARLSVVVKTGKPADFVPSIRGEEADCAAFVGAMHNSSGIVTNIIVNQLQPLKFNHLLDIGCASGTWTIAFLKAVPRARATLFDKLPVIYMAQKRISEAGMYDRITLVGGDFYTDDLPAGADFAWLGAICHQNSREQNRELFVKIHKALKENSTLIVRDVVMNSSHTSPTMGALFAVNMLVATEGGGTYSFEEYRHDLCSAGFNEVELIRQDEFMNSLIRAKKADK